MLDETETAGSQPGSNEHKEYSPVRDIWRRHQNSLQYAVLARRRPGTSRAIPTTPCCSRLVQPDRKTLSSAIDLRDNQKAGTPLYPGPDSTESPYQLTGPALCR